MDADSRLVPLDAFASLRTTALVALVTASFSSPIVAKSGVVSDVGHRLGQRSAQVEPAETIVAGGIEFAMPASWGRLGASASAAAGAPVGEEAIGTVVGALCPGGASGAACREGQQLTLVAYSGEEGHALPLATLFEQQLDDRLGRALPGFRRGDVAMRPGADGIRYLDYEFSFRSGARRVSQRIAAYRTSDGGGVVVLVTGPASAGAKGIGAFLASAHEAGDEAA